MDGAKIAGPRDEPESTERARAGFARLEKTMRWNAQDAAQKDGRLRYTSDQALGRELRNRLRLVYRNRLSDGLAVGNLDGWAGTLCRIAARCNSAVSIETVLNHVAFVGIQIPMGILTPVVEEAAAAFAAGALSHSPVLLGEMIQLTSAEREECAIDRLIDACDESRTERTRRLARERQRRRRVETKARQDSEAMTSRPGAAVSRPPISFHKE